MSTIRSTIWWIAECVISRDAFQVSLLWCIDVTKPLLHARGKSHSDFNIQPMPSRTRNFPGRFRNSHSDFNIQEPNNPLLLTNYTQFLCLVDHDYDRAEEYFKRAVAVEPPEAEAFDKYAAFLWLGMATITVSAILPKLHPPPCPTQLNCTQASGTQLMVLYLALLLTSLGAGGIRPCVVAFAADQFDMTKVGVAGRTWNFFNWYYFCMGLATLTALTVVVYIQDNVGWGWGFGLPTIAMALSVMAFVVGSPLYNKLKPSGSRLVRLSQVVVAAVKKRKAVLPEDPKLLYRNHKLDTAIAIQGRLVHTDQFKWLDKAAVITTQDSINDPPNFWRLATVHRIEELKSIIRMLPIWAAGILLVTASSHQHSFTIQQARTMNRHLTPTFQIPPASLSIFGILSMLTGLVLYERLLVPFAKKFTKNPSGITCLQRMGVGFAINILATLVSSLVEIRRKNVAAKHNLLDDPTAIIPFSVFWLVPQFWLHGIAEVFMSVGHLEFMYDQSPESLRSTATALYWLAISVGNYVGTLMVYLVNKYSGKEHNWLPDRNLNRGRLEYYYWLVSGIQVLNLVYYVVCAWFYTYKPLEEETEGSDGRECLSKDGCEETKTA